MFLKQYFYYQFICKKKKDSSSFSCEIHFIMLQKSCLHFDHRIPSNHRIYYFNIKSLYTKCMDEYFLFEKDTSQVYRTSVIYIYF